MVGLPDEFKPRPLLDGLLGEVQQRFGRIRSPGLEITALIRVGIRFPVNLVRDQTYEPQTGALQRRSCVHTEAG